MSTAAAIDRQIRPIYDALDTNSNKSAVLACNKLLKKSPKNELVKALKALALVRMQKVEESLALCDEVLSTKPTDDNTLTAMMHVLRGLGRNTDMVKMYDDAFKQQPGNEETACQAFFANSRIGNWKAAQQVATKMQKSFQDDRYVFWNALAAVLQAKDPATPPAMQSILFKLAHRLLTASPNLSFMTADRLYFHLSVLKELELWEEVDALMESKVGKMISSTSLVCEEIRREIAQARGLWVEEGERAKEQILDKRDRNWLEFLSVLDATFSYVASPQALAASPTPSDSAKEDCSKHISRTRDFFLRISEQDGVSDRSALLGLVELERRARLHGLSTDSSELSSLVESYYHRVGDKACCFEDLKPYTATFSETERSQWLAFLDSTIVPCDSLANLRRLINVHKLRRDSLGESDVTAEAESARAVEYLKAYFEALKFGGDLPDTELQPADDLAILAAMAYVNVWHVTDIEGPLFNAASVLEYGLTKSKQAFQMRIMLVRIYQLLAAPSLALEHYRALNIKQVQTDTMSHLILSRASMFSLAATGDITLLNEAVESTQIYHSNSTDTPDMIVRAFTGEKFSQVPAFLEFHDQLERSLQRDLIKIEHVRMQIAHETVNQELVDMYLIDLKFNFDRFHHDNRDYAIIPDYQPSIVDSFEKQTRLFDQQGLEWLWIYLKIYIRALQQGSDLDDTVEEKLLIGDRPKPSNDPENKIPLKERLVQKRPNEEEELTKEEAALYHYACALADWLGPHHDYIRPPPHEVLAEAARQTELKTGQPLRGVELPPKNGSPTNGHSKKEEDAPPVKDVPPFALEFFDDMQVSFKDAVERKSFCEALYFATLTQEALILLTVETLRFKSASVVKMHKLGNLVQSIKDIRTKGAAATKAMSAELVQMSEQEGTAEKRKAFVEACKPIQFSEIDHDFVLAVAKKVGDARKKVLEGVGKGVAKLSVTHGP